MELEKNVHTDVLPESIKTALAQEYEEGKPAAKERKKRGSDNKDNEPIKKADLEYEYDHSQELVTGIFKNLYEPGKSLTFTCDEDPNLFAVPEKITVHDRCYATITRAQEKHLNSIGFIKPRKEYYTDPNGKRRVRVVEDTVRRYAFETSENPTAGITPGTVIQQGKIIVKPGKH